MNQNKAEVAADLLAGSRGTHNTFITVQRADVVLALGSIPADVLDHEATPTSQYVIVRRKALIAALEALKTNEPDAKRKPGV